MSIIKLPLHFEGSLGEKTFQKWRIKLDFEHDTVIIDPKVAKAILK
jgi:hypothetical protein